MPDIINFKPHNAIFSLLLTAHVVSQDCDFESSQCGYTQSRSDKFDWTWRNALPASPTKTWKGSWIDHTSQTSSFKSK